MSVKKIVHGSGGIEEYDDRRSQRSVAELRNDEEGNLTQRAKETPDPVLQYAMMLLSIAVERCDDDDEGNVE